MLDNENSNYSSYHEVCKNVNINRIENLEIPQIPWTLVQPEANVVPKTNKKSSEDN